MPKAGRLQRDLEGHAGTLWYVSCTCGWSCVRRFEDQAHAAADTHAVLKHAAHATMRPTC